MEDIFYTYIYLDPRKLGNYEYDDIDFSYEPFYIGKGKDTRDVTHLKEPKNSFLENKIKRISSEGFEPIISRFSENLCETEAFDLEIELIRKIGRRDLGLGPLTNLTDGGEGISGMSDQVRQQISIKLKGREVWNKGLRGAQVSYWKGKTLPSNMRKSISESCKGRAAWNVGIPRTPEVKNILSEANKGNVPLNKEKTLEEFHGIEKADEIRQKIKEARTNQLPPISKGSTYEEIYGIEKANDLKKTLSEFNLKNGIQPPSQKGKFWITNGIDNRLSFEIPKGWQKGRTLKRKLKNGKEKTS